MRRLTSALAVALTVGLAPGADAASCRIVRTSQGTVFDSCGGTACIRQPDNRMYVHVYKTGPGTVTGTMTCGDLSVSCSTHPVLLVDSCLAAQFLPPEYDGAALGCDATVTPHAGLEPVAWTVSCSVGF